MARHDEIRIGDAERDAVMVALHDHFAEGRLDRGELDERLDAVLSAKTRGDLRTLVKDLPSPTGLPEPEKAPAPAHPSCSAARGTPRGSITATWPVITATARASRRSHFF